MGLKCRWCFCLKGFTNCTYFITLAGNWGFRFNEAFFWSHAKWLCCTSAFLHGMGHFNFLCWGSTKRATYSPELHQVKMKARWLFSLFCLLSGPSVAGKGVRGTPWLSLWWRVVRGRLGLVGLSRVSCSYWRWFSISWQLSNNPSYNVQLVRSKWLVLTSRLLNSICLTCQNNHWDELTWS